MASALRDRFVRLIGRKMMAFYIIEGICGAVAWRRGMTWPVAFVMTVAIILLIVGVSGEKFLGVIERIVERRSDKP